MSIIEKQVGTKYLWIMMMMNNLTKEKADGTRHTICFCYKGFNLHNLLS